MGRPAEKTDRVTIDMASEPLGWPAMRALVPEGKNDHAQRRSLVRAITAAALWTARRTNPVNVLSRNWPRDVMAERALNTITRGAAEDRRRPSAGGAGRRMLRRLAPKSAALQLFDAGMTVDMTGGVATVRIPNVGDVPPAKFVAEGEPAPVVQFALGGATLGPTKKIVMLSAITREFGNREPVGIEGHRAPARVECRATHRCRGLRDRGRRRRAASRPVARSHAGTPDGWRRLGRDDPRHRKLGRQHRGSRARCEHDGDRRFTEAGDHARAAGRTRFTYPIFSTAALPAGSVAAFAPDAIAAAFEGRPSARCVQICDGPGAAAPRPPPQFEIFPHAPPPFVAGLDPERSAPCVTACAARYYCWAWRFEISSRSTRCESMTLR